MLIDKAQRAAPAAPALVSKSNAIVGNWVRPTFAEYSAMAVYRYTSSTNAASDVSSYLLDTYTDDVFIDLDDDLVVGQTYYYRIASIDVYGHESVKSSVVSVTYQPVKATDTDATVLVAPGTPVLSQIDQDINGDGTVDTALSVNLSSLVSGAVRYEIEVSSAPLPSSGDNYYSNVVALFNFDGANGSTTFTNGAPVSRTLTAGSSGPKLSNTGAGAVLPNFGTNALNFTGTTGEYATSDVSTDLNLPGDFTIEMYAFVDPTMFFGTWGIFRQSGAADGSAGTLSIYSSTGSRFYVDVRGSGSVTTISTTLSSSWIVPNMWTHLCVERKGSTVYFYQDGVIIGQTTCTGTLLATGQFELGRGKLTDSLIYAGKIDAFRITKGVARYDGRSFSPPKKSHPTTSEALVYSVIDNITSVNFPVVFAGSTDRYYKVRAKSYSFNGTPGNQSGYSNEVRPTRRNCTIPLPTSLTAEVNTTSFYAAALSITGLPTVDKTYSYTEVWVSNSSLFQAPILWMTYVFNGNEEARNSIQMVHANLLVSGYFVKIRHVDKIGNPTIFYPINSALNVTPAAVIESWLIKADSITTVKINDGAVTSAKIGATAVTDVDVAGSSGAITIGTAYVDVHTLTLSITDLRQIMFTIRFIADVAGTYDIQVRQNVTEVFAVTGVVLSAGELFNLVDIYNPAILPGTSTSFTLRVKASASGRQISQRRFTATNIKH